MMSDWILSFLFGKDEEMEDLSSSNNEETELTVPTSLSGWLNENELDWSIDRK